MELMKCPQCGHENPMMTVENEVRKFLCRHCGMAYYGPDGCITEPDKPDPVPDDS